MRNSREYRRMAREALRGKWQVAVLAGIVASLLGGTGIGISPSGTTASTGEMGLRDVLAVGSAMRMATVLSIGFAVLSIAIGGVMLMGYSRFNLRLVDGEEELRIRSLFDYFDQILRGIGMVLRQALFIFLWALPGIVVCGLLVYFLLDPLAARTAGMSYEESLVAVGTVIVPIVLLATVPAIAASYRYTLVPYLMAEDRQLRAKDAMNLSVRLMKGHKWQIFCLNFSFLGWEILSMFTMGIGTFFVLPYRMAAQTAFVRDLLPRQQEQNLWEGYCLQDHYTSDMD